MTATLPAQPKGNAMPTKREKANYHPWPQMSEFEPSGNSGELTDEQADEFARAAFARYTGRTDWEGAQRWVLEAIKSATRKHGLQVAAQAAPVPSADAAAGVLPVVMDLLRECVGPLEVSDAVLPSEDYGVMADLIDRVKSALNQYDTARAAQQGAKS